MNQNRSLVFVLTRFLYANPFPPPDQVRGHASLENAIGSNRLQETLVRRASAATIRDEVERSVLRLDRYEFHPLAAFDAGHFGGGLKTRTGRRGSGKVQHCTLLFVSSFLVFSLCFSNC